MEFLDENQEKLLNKMLKGKTEFCNNLNSKIDDFNKNGRNYEIDKLIADLDDMEQKGFAKFKRGKGSPVFNGLLVVDNIPMVAGVQITHDGFKYFENSQTYINARLREMGFPLLDENCENFLIKIQETAKKCGNSLECNGNVCNEDGLESLQMLKKLDEFKYINISYTGEMMDRSFHCHFHLTYNGRTYFDEKARQIAEIKILGDKRGNNMQNIGNQVNITGGSFENSPIQTGDGNVQNFNQFGDAFQEIRDCIEKESISDEDKEALREALNDAEGKIKKEPSKKEIAMKVLSKLADALRAPLVVALIKKKFPQIFGV